MADVAARGNRATEERRERRYKPGATQLDGLKLHVPEDKLDRKRFEYRWVNNKGNRIQQMHDRDWDPAPEIANGASTTKRVVGLDGAAPMDGMLMRKHRDWYDQDQKTKRRPLDEMEASIKRGTAHKDEKDLDGVSYTPGTNMHAADR